MPKIFHRLYRGDKSRSERGLGLGLSLVQAMEVVVEEMPEPTNQEFSVLLGENKMGITLEEAFAHLYERMPSVALQQVITTILLARETGGTRETRKAK